MTYLEWILVDVCISAVMMGNKKSRLVGVNICRIIGIKIRRIVGVNILRALLGRRCERHLGMAPCVFKIFEQD